MALTNADGRQLAQGANRALIGHEFIQFGRAVPLGNARWRLEQLLRGARRARECGGRPCRQRAVHSPRRPPAPARSGADRHRRRATILASGLGDVDPVTTPIMLEGISRRPLSPVHARITWLAGDGLELGWTRRARGAMTWDDGIEIPLNEQSETYRLTLGPLAAPLATWVLTEPRLASMPPLWRACRLVILTCANWAASPFRNRCSSPPSLDATSKESPIHERSDPVFQRQSPLRPTAAFFRPSAKGSLRQRSARTGRCPSALLDRGRGFNAARRTRRRHRVAGRSFSQCGMGRPEGMVACRQSGNWLFVQPRDGTRLLDRSTGQSRMFLGSWQIPTAPVEPSGGSVVDSEARAAILGLILALRTAGVLPTT